MAWHDFYCARCGQVLTNVNVPIAIGQIAGAPEHCGATTVPIPGIGRMDIGAVKGASFTAFHTTDGRGQPVFIDSTHKLRQVERESEQMFRDGVGQPMVFRRWAQNDTNQDQPTLSRSYDGSEQPTAEAKHRFGSTRQSHGAVTVEGAADLAERLDTERRYGPGVDDRNASALPLEGGK